MQKKGVRQVSKRTLEKKQAAEINKVEERIARTINQHTVRVLFLVVLGLLAIFVINLAFFRTPTPDSLYLITGDMNGVLRMKPNQRSIEWELISAVKIDTLQIDDQQICSDGNCYSGQFRLDGAMLNRKLLANGGVLSANLIKL